MNVSVQTVADAIWDEPISSHCVRGTIVFNTDSNRSMIWDGNRWVDANGRPLSKKKRTKRYKPGRYLDIMGHIIGTALIVAPIAAAVWYIFYG